MSKQVMQRALEALEHHVAQTRPIEKTSQAIAELRAAIADADAIDTSQGWLPIESAPKDGYFLVYEDGAMRALFRSNGVFQPVGYPALVTSNWGDKLVGDEAKRVLQPMGFRLEMCDGCCENPTHWQPLPAAPSTKEETE